MARPREAAACTNSSHSSTSVCVGGSRARETVTVCVATSTEATSRGGRQRHWQDERLHCPSASLVEGLGISDISHWWPRYHPEGGRCVAQPKVVLM